MKKIKSITYILLLSFLCGCGNSNSSFDADKIKISIKDSSFFTALENTAYIDYNSDFTTTLKMREGYAIESCSYENYTAEKTDTDEYCITFKNITRPVAIKIYSYLPDGFNTVNEGFEASIQYNFNDSSDKYEIKSYSLSYHIRPNTWTATTLKRDGYTLNGWNTSADLTGTHIGLGSRASVQKGETLQLYAEWIKWTEPSDFLYKRNEDDTISLSGYKGKGTDEYFCIPEYIDNYKVTGILNSLTRNIPCGKISSSSLIIPNTILSIEDYAFNKSDFKNIYFSDNLNFSYNCFGYNISHYFINAYQSPKMQKENYNVRFADNLDLLIQYQNEKKIVLYGGCNLAYGIYSPMIEKEFSDYKVINCGLNGEFNSLFQMQIIENYLNSDDIFIHAPEQMNGYQFLNKLLVDSRIFSMVEGNYDLLSIADFSYSKFVIEAYTDFNKLRDENEECTYEDYPGLFNTYGDYLDDRNYSELNEYSRDISHTENWKYDLSLLEGDNIAMLGNIYNDIASKGVTVYYTHAPMNENSCEEDVIYERALEFQTKLEDVFKDYNVTFISEITDYIFKGRYFFDTDYHLNYYGAELRTEKLIDDLKKAGVK